MVLRINRPNILKRGESCVKQAIKHTFVNPKDLKPIAERQEGSTIIRSFIVGEDRQQTDQRIITDVKRIFTDVKKKHLGSQ